MRDLRWLYTVEKKFSFIVQTQDTIIKNMIQYLLNYSYVANYIIPWIQRVYNLRERENYVHNSTTQEKYTIKISEYCFVAINGPNSATSGARSPLPQR